MRKRYTATLSARLGDKTSGHTLRLFADGYNAAVESVSSYAKDTVFPVKDGWREHTVNVVEFKGKSVDF